MVSATKDPLTFNDLMATPIDFSNIELEYNFQECFNALTDKLDWNNPEGDRYPFDLSKPLPFISTIKHAYDKDAEKGIKHWGERHKLWYQSQIVMKRSDQQLYKFKECDFVDLHLNDIEDML
ncbi:hypothetical protein Tco_0569641 [Tanacetum coccineum]